MESFGFAQYRQDAGESVAAACREKASIPALLTQLQWWSDDAEEHLAQHPSDRSQIACGPGCSSCCMVNVATLLPEGFAIARYLSQQGEAQVGQAYDRLDCLWREVRGLDDDDRLFVRRSCAFLDDEGSCGIYPVRPLLCRSVTSTSALSCREALSGKLLGEEKAVLMHQFQQGLYEALFSGIAEGLEQGGKDGRSYPLAGLLRYLLKNPDFEGEWLAGRRLIWFDIY